MLVMNITNMLPIVLSSCLFKSVFTERSSMGEKKVPFEVL